MPFFALSMFRVQTGLCARSLVLQPNDSAVIGYHMLNHLLKTIRNLLLDDWSFS